MPKNPADDRHSQLNLDLLRHALADDGKITEDEREELLYQGIPDILCEALADGRIDAEEMQRLTKAGVPKQLLLALEDGKLTDDEITELKRTLVADMRQWRAEQMQSLLTLFEKIGD